MPRETTRPQRDPSLGMLGQLCDRSQRDVLGGFDLLPSPGDLPNRII